MNGQLILKLFQPSNCDLIFCSMNKAATNPVLMRNSIIPTLGQAIM